MAEKFTAYMDGIDFNEERGQPRGGNVLFATPEAVLRHRTCSEECGVVEVEVKRIRWVREQSLRTTYTAEAVAAKRAERRAELETELGPLVDEIWGKPKDESVQILADWITDRRRKEGQGG